MTNRVKLAAQLWSITVSSRLPRIRSRQIIDSDGPIGGLVGRYFEGKSPKYVKDATRPSFGDLT
jgi:hypothetical protein